ncbi:CitMHS family transporter [Halotalea alkalilenta]|uniref:Citrate transporter n=1 Tax=Halotalea alkalilenta TaxID=376489 RepID=A0A172YEQ6_9GAMM|nr:CitMHS family transporter [Halotalea alkalilenta]ANF57750.1 citrate transporter [Halotalea alkalilenta]
MLTTLGFGMVASFMYLIMSKRLTPVLALILVPIIFGLLAGAGGELGAMMLDGIRNIAPTGVLLMFAILYFGIMIDTGLFDHPVRLILKLVKGDPLKVVIGSVALALLVSLDGDGSTTYMICCAAMLPLYKRLGINPLIMTCLFMLASGVMNLTPWGGPTARAASALSLDPADIFVPMILPMVAAIAWLFLLASLFGLRERKRLGVLKERLVENDTEVFVSPDEHARRPKLLWFNGLLTLGLMAALISGILPLPILFMIGFCIAMVVNYPSLAMQKARIDSYAPSVLAVVSIIFAAGVFTGILGGTGMVEAMSTSLISVIPPSMGPYLAPITALLGLPFTFLMSNDAFYFGVLPVLAETASHYGISTVEIARASIICQPFHLLSPLVPSTYLLVGLAGVDFGDHQRFTFFLAIITSLVMMFAAMALGMFPLLAS